jgi:hypothetical protein
MTAPAVTLSRAILEGSLSVAGSLRPSMSHETQADNEKNWVYVLFEIQYLLFHFVSRLLIVRIGPEKRSALLDEIAPLVIGPTIEAVFSHWPDDLKKKIEGEHYQNLADSELEYGSCKTLFADNGVENLNDVVMHRFGKNVANTMGGEHNLGLIIDIQRTVLEGIESIHLTRLLEEVCAAL